VTKTWRAAPGRRLGPWMLRTWGFAFSTWGIWWIDRRGSTHLLLWRDAPRRALARLANALH